MLLSQFLKCALKGTHPNNFRSLLWMSNQNLELLSLTDEYCELGPDPSDLKAQLIMLNSQSQQGTSQHMSNSYIFFHACPPVKRKQWLHIRFFP